MNCIEQECIDLNDRGKCLNKGNKVKWAFAIMPGVLFNSNSSRMLILFGMNSEKVFIVLVVSNGLYELKNMYSWVIILWKY